MSRTDDPQIVAYLAELDRLLGGLPGDRRAEIVRDIRAHIEGALADGAAGVDRGSSVAVHVAEVLDHLGTPQEIADAAYGEMPVPVTTHPSSAYGGSAGALPGTASGGSRIAGRDTTAIILVLLGGFAFGVGWLIGIVLLWSSTAWRTRDKWIGTLLIPGGLAGTLLLGGLATSVSVRTCASVPGSVPVPAVSFSAAGPGELAFRAAGDACGGGPHWVPILLLAFVLLAPLFTTFWLIRTARRRR